MNHPLFRRFGNELEVGEQRLEWMMREHDFLFRPAGSDVSIVWCELLRRDLLRRDLPEALSDVARRKRVEKRLAKNLLNHRVLRLWPLDAERELVLGLDFALMRHVEADFWLRLDWLYSFFKSGDDLLFRTDLSGLEIALEPFESAWDFVTDLMRGKEHHWQWFEAARGNIDELKRGLWAYMTLSGHYLNSFERGDLRFCSLLLAPHDASSSDWLQLRRVAELLDTHFVLRLNHFARRVHTREGKPRKRPEIYIRPPVATSAHERLEALLLWRDFLRGKLSEEEIEALLPQR